METKQVQGQFAVLQINSEDKRTGAMCGSVRHSEKTVEEDFMMNDNAARSSSLESVAGHAKLQRRHSDGIQQYTRRNSLCLPSTTKLPKISARRLLSDTPGSSGCELSRSHKTRQHDRNQGFPGSDLNTGSFQLKRKSLPHESTSSSGSRHAHGDRGVLTRRRSAPWSSTSKQRESGVNSRNEASSWQIKKHKRSLNIDDDDSDNLEESWSRRSSSSSGFSSQSSLVI